jgi:hypothetical protein
MLDEKITAHIYLSDSANVLSCVPHLQDGVAATPLSEEPLTMRQAIEVSGSCCQLHQGG